MISGIQGNMSISSDMMLQRQQEMCGRIDQNSDGKLDETEVQALADKIAERGGMSVSAEDIMANADTNGDNMISEDEFAAMKPPRPPQSAPTYNLADILAQESEDSETYDMTGALLDVLS